MTQLQPFSVHNHTHASNFRLRDAINKPEDLLDYALELGLPGLVITDHEILSSHVKAHQYIESNREKFGDFVLGFGNEIYLVEKDDTLKKKEENEKISFHHFILIAKDNKGYEGLRKLTSRAWGNSFFYRGMERVPTYKDELMAVMDEYRGHIIATTACVGGELPQLLIKYHNEPTPENKQKVHNFIVWLKGVFGEDIYFELQPSKNEDQLIANKMLKSVGAAYGVNCIVSTDAHYLHKEQALAHKIYLTASQGEREVDAFYATTYVMDRAQLAEYFDEILLEELIENTQLIKNSLSPITFEQEVKIPLARIPEYVQNDLFKPYLDKYEYINKYHESSYKMDRYYLHLIAEGMISHNEELNELNLSRIDTELNELYHITEKLQQPMSSYFVLTKDVVDLIWEISLLGVSRGSASCFYLNYLLDIVQINPIVYNLPHWRFLSKERAELPDIDLDFEGARRHEIMQKVKEVYGEDNVLNMGTFTTEGTKSTVLTSCRGLGIDKDLAHNISALVPADKQGHWPLKDAFFGNDKKDRKPAREFIAEVDKYEGLREAMLAIEGIISGRGQHASGVIIFPNGYVSQNAMMKTTSGLAVTQFDMYDSVFMGGLKLDFLSINALDRIRSAIELLLKNNLIEWKGTLRKTYDAYFHPDKLDLDSPDMYQMLFDGHVFNAFQFETQVGQQALSKINPRTFDELCAGNSLMRLTTSGEQPLDKYVRFKNNIDEWYREMKEYMLEDSEIKVLEKHLLDRYGICDTQEALMTISMDPEISGFTLAMANKFRKAVAKQNQRLIEQQRELFFSYGKQLGTRPEFLQYVWKEALSPQFGYAFSLPHIAGYTLILMIEMNIAYRYGSAYWKTACLTVNSGLIGEGAGGTNYGAIAKAVGDMKEYIVPPSINKSDAGFTPLDTDRILFGLKPIIGLGMAAIQEIVDNRPFASFDDFFDKLIATGKIPISKGIVLIKAGCFDEFNKDRRSLMIDYVRKVVPAKEKLTMVQLKALIPYIDQTKFFEQLAALELRNRLFGRSKEKMTPELEVEFMNFAKKYEHIFQIKYDFDKGYLEVDPKTFDKVYAKVATPLREWLATEEAISLFNKMKLREFWSMNCMGSVESWEMETILFYTDKHELDYVPLNRFFDIVDFELLPELPLVTHYKRWRGREIPQFKIEVIAGTVVDKTKGKSLIHVATQYGVVTVRYSKGQFAHYDKKIVRVDGKNKEVVDVSWFEKGTKLVLVGYRREKEFVLSTRNSPYNHTTFRINSYDSENVNLQNEKVME